MHVTRRTCLAAAAAIPVAGKAGSFDRSGALAMKVQRFDPELDRILSTHANVEVIASGYRWTEGPVWVRDGGYLLFSDVPANVVHRWQPGKGAAPFLRPSGLAGPIPAAIREAGANGLAIDAQGRLVMADSGTRVIARVDLKTKRKTILADRYAGKRFNSCNDVAIARSGAIYFTDPPYGLAEGDASPLKEMRANGVYRLETDGRVTQLEASLTRPNGIGLSPDERTLYVAQSDEQRPVILAYTLDAAGLSTKSRVIADFKREVDAKLPGLPDGMEVGASGHLFASGPGGIYILAADGRRLGLISTGKPAANCTFGEDGRTLFVTSSDMVARVRLKLSGW